MKKILFAVIAFTGLTTATMAQTTAPAKKNDAAKVHYAQDNTAKKKEVKAPAVTTQKQPAPVPAKKETASATKAGSKTAVKKDGTPDMRYKANKESASAKKTTHTKKDGTPDKRFKENKKSA